MASLKTEVDQLDIDKLVSVLVDLSKLSDEVKNYVVKKIECNKLVAKGDNIGFILKTKYYTHKSELTFLTLVVLLKRRITILR